LIYGWDRTSGHGTGINGQLLGITGTPGIGSFSGTTLAIGGIVDAFTALGDGLGNGGGVASEVGARASYNVPCEACHVILVAE
jgi:hypothetical protein